jgi:hypothetical protein
LKPLSALALIDDLLDDSDSRLFVHLSNKNEQMSDRCQGKEQGADERLTFGINERHSLRAQPPVEILNHNRGPALHSMRLVWGMFGASAMKVEGVGLHLTQMKVTQLAGELSEHKAAKSGRKRALQLRGLRALIIADAARPTPLRERV